MKYSATTIVVGILLFLGFLDTFSYDLPNIWSWGGAESGNLTIDYLHALNRKINLLIMLVGASIYSVITLAEALEKKQKDK